MGKHIVSWKKALKDIDNAKKEVLKAQSTGSKLNAIHISITPKRADIDIYMEE